MKYRLVIHDQQDRDSVVRALANAGYKTRVLVDVDVLKGNTYYVEYEVDLEPLSPQEEVEELTKEDFLHYDSDSVWLTCKGRDKLIRIISRRGKDTPHE